MLILLKLAVWAPIPALLIWALLASRRSAKKLATRPTEPAKAQGVRDLGFGFWPTIDNRDRAESAARMAALPLAAPLGAAIILALGAAFLVAATALIAAPLAYFGAPQAQALLDGLLSHTPSLAEAAVVGAACLAAFALLAAALRLRAGRIAAAPMWATLSALPYLAQLWTLAAAGFNASAEWSRVLPGLLFGLPSLLILLMLISSLRGWLWLKRRGVPLRL